MNYIVLSYAPVLHALHLFSMHSRVGGVPCAGKRKVSGGDVLLSAWGLQQQEVHQSLFVLTQDECAMKIILNHLLFLVKC